MTKFKVAFTMDAKTLFLIMSKLLPVEDLKIEEKLDEAELQAAIHALAPRALLAKTSAKTSAKRKWAKSRPSIPFNPDKGINKIILDLLAKRPHRAIEMRKPLEDGGYSRSSVSSRLAELKNRGAVVQNSDGLWSLSEAGQTKLAQPQREVKLHAS
jgi:hypothetical protein